MANFSLEYFPSLIGALIQRAFNPHKISLKTVGLQEVFLSFRYSFMLYFSYEIGPCFAFFHVKCTEEFQSFTKHIGILDLVRVGQY